MMNYYESPQAAVSWNEAIRTVIVEWKGYAQGEQFQTPLNKGLELMMQKKAEKLLIDTSKSSASRQDDQKWIVQTWHPKVMEAGLQFAAVVTPEKVIANVSLNSVVSALGSTYTMEHFNTSEEAAAWLSTVNSIPGPPECSKPVAGSHS